jgi:fluoride exporter
LQLAAGDAYAARMNAFLLVGLGGAIGAMTRFGIGRLLGASSFPWATLTVNVVGGLLMGLLAGWLVARNGNEPLQLFLGVGVLGGFTTFSAFSLETILLIVRGAPGQAALYVLASVVASVAAVAIGLWLTRDLLA